MCLANSIIVSCAMSSSSFLPQIVTQRDDAQPAPHSPKPLPEQGEEPAQPSSPGGGLFGRSDKESPLTLRKVRYSEVELREEAFMDAISQDDGNKLETESREILSTVHELTHQTNEPQKRG